MVLPVARGAAAGVGEELLQAGISGVVVDLEPGVKGELSQLRQAIDALPPFRRRKSKAEALLPYVGEEEVSEPEEEEEED